MESDEISVDAVVSSETQPLLSSPSGLAIIISGSLRGKLTTCAKHVLPRHICQLSKAAIAVIVINIVVCAAYTITLNVGVVTVGAFNGALLTTCVMYFFLAVITLFSPLSGFLADVCCGRYRVIYTGIWLIFCAFLITSMCAILTLILGADIWYINRRHFFLLLVFLIALTFVTGLGCYWANFIQFGLEQLLDAPSASLALFIHWVTWAGNLGALVIQVVLEVLWCKYEIRSRYGPFCGLSIALTLLFLIIILLFRRRWFYIERGQHNPYRRVASVLNYARKHKYPLQRSAFTYCGDEDPTRIDFAKERYGGPFTTEQVEDVKTFVRIFLVLIALGPVFILEIPASFIVLTIFGVHIGRYHLTNQDLIICFDSHPLLDKSSIPNIVAVLFLPVYIWIVFSALRRRVPKIFVRLVISVVLYLFGVASMLCIDLAGHLKARGDTTGNGSMCMFSAKHVLEQGPLLGLHWAIFLIPGVLLGIGPPLVMATTFEFISAQSTFAMKGLLVGVFFTIRAVFQLVSGAALVPFAYKSLWSRHHMIEHPPVTNCGFGYLLFTCVVALIGVVLLSVVAKRYKYRERDDRPYDQRFAVDVYGRYIEQAHRNNLTVY